MANSYYYMTYGGFKKPVIKEQNDIKYTQKDAVQFTKDWNEVTERLRNSGVDLSRILLVGK